MVDNDVEIAIKAATIEFRLWRSLTFPQRQLSAADQAMQKELYDKLELFIQLCRELDELKAAAMPLLLEMQGIEEHPGIEWSSFN